MTVSASELWRGADNMDAIETNINQFDSLLTEKDNTIHALEAELAQLKEEQPAEVPQETLDKAQAFDSVAQKIEEVFDYELTVDNYDDLIQTAFDFLNGKPGIYKQLIKILFN